MEKKIGLGLISMLLMSGCSTTDSSKKPIGVEYKQAAQIAQGVVPTSSDVAIIRNSYENVLWEKDSYQKLMRDGWVIQREYVPSVEPVKKEANNAPEPIVVPVVITKISKSVHFAFDSEEVTKKEKEQLKPGPWGEADDVIIDGYTDSIGSDQYNQKLSARRANAVANYLYSLGVQKDRVRIMGHGEAEPVDSNRTSQGRAKNRRVMVILNVKSNTPKNN